MNPSEATQSSCLGTWAAWKVAQLDTTARPKNLGIFQQVQIPNQLTQAQECLILHGPSVCSFRLHLACLDFLIISNPLAHCSVLSFIHFFYFFFPAIILLILARGGRGNVFFHKSQNRIFLLLCDPLCLFILPVLSPSVLRRLLLRSSAPQSHSSTSVPWFCRVVQTRGFASEQDTQF